MLINFLLILIIFVTLIHPSFCIECSPEYFGMDCSELCSENCINKKQCHHVSGVCFNGCQDGYIGSLCTDGKKYSFFCKVRSTWITKGCSFAELIWLGSKVKLWLYQIRSHRVDKIKGRWFFEYYFANHFFLNI